ncbi:MAG TPA: CPBP family intramembrane glutamic endopeptidase, partial [Phycisphaerales bacterium]|nr:CPBP family intramembrane glutamic endopeptidase [Phycisphaerales bacterium]
MMMQNLNEGAEQGFPVHGMNDAWEGARLDESNESEKRPRRAFAWLAWILIVVMVAGVMVLQADRGEEREEEPMTDSSVQARILELQGKVIFAQNEAAPGQVNYQQVEKTFNIGPVPQRQRFICLTGEIFGSSKAAETLNELDQLIADAQAKGTLTSKQVGKDLEVQAILHKLYDGEAAAATQSEEKGVSPETTTENVIAAASEGIASVPTGPAPQDLLTEDEQQVLVDQLGWFGKLALHPSTTTDEAGRKQLEDSTTTLMAATIGLTISGIGIGALGFVGLVVILCFAFLRKLHGGLAPTQTNTGVYAETFALWMMLFLGLQVGAQILGGISPSLGLWPEIAAFFLSLVVLGWPVMRGVPWSEVRRDIGWTTGRKGGVIEPMIAVPGYVMTLPVLFGGVLLTLVFVLISGALQGGADPNSLDPVSGPSHPIVPEVLNGGWGVRATIYFVACVCAPIVEETMFRGVLYRHLRGASGKIG